MDLRTLNLSKQEYRSIILETSLTPYKSQALLEKKGSHGF